MPAGLSVDNSSSSGNGVGCLANVFEPKGIKQTASAGVSLDDNRKTPMVIEKPSTFSNGATAYKKIVSTLNCYKHVSGTSGREKNTAAIGQVSFPHYGNASAACSVSLVTRGTAIGEDLLIVRKGNIVMGIQEADLPPVSVSQFQGFVVKALAKVK